MIKISFFLLFYLFLYHSTNADNYYLSIKSGDDNRSSVQAKNKLTPWKSIDRLNAFSSNLKSNDSVFFRRGEIFYGTVIISSSGTLNHPIYFSSYGDGPNAIISGFQGLSNWVLYKKNIYSHSLNIPFLNMLTLNDTFQHMGRYPNEGFLTFQHHIKNMAIIDTNLSILNNWKGSELVIRKYRWILDRQGIIDQSHDTLFYNALNNYGDNNSYSPLDNNGYFIQNSLQTLDKNGEWYYDAKGKKLYAYFSISPTTNIVKASSLNNNLIIDSKSYLVFDSINFEGSNLDGLKIINSENIKIENCNLSNEGGNAIFGNRLNHVTIENCHIINSLNNAIKLTSSANNTIINNVTIKNSNNILGTGESGNFVGCGIIIYGDTCTIIKNKILNSGYHGIQFQGNHFLIQNNIIDSFCITKDDGGGIYTVGGFQNLQFYKDRIILGNIIMNGMGANKMTSDTLLKLAHGIYMDDNTNNVSILNNSIFNCGESGVYIHNSYNVIIENNTIYNCKNSFLAREDHKLKFEYFVKNNVVKNNIFFCKTPEQKVMNLESIFNDIKHIALFDSNYYCRPLADANKIITSFINYGNPTFTSYNLKEWQLMYCGDKNSRTTVNNPISAYTLMKLKGSNLIPNGSFQNNITGVYQYSFGKNLSINWKPFSNLDTGALEISFNSNLNTPSLVLVNVGALQKYNNYVVKFSMLGTKSNHSIRAFLRTGIPPYNDISDRKYAKLFNFRTENELIFSSSSNCPNGQLVFEINDFDSLLWIDNIKMYDADINFVNPDLTFRYEYNTSEYVKKIYLDKIYIDVENNKYYNTILLDPYSSKILLVNTINNFIYVRSQRKIHLKKTFFESEIIK